MRTKNFLVLLVFVFGVSMMLIVFGSQRSQSLHNIVSTTHQHIRSFQDTLMLREVKSLHADDRYLRLLGLAEPRKAADEQQDDVEDEAEEASPRYYPNDTWKNTTLPVIVTYVSNGQESQAIGLMNSVSRTLPNNTVLVYGVGLSTYSMQNLLNYCNSSRCQVHALDVSRFPSHLAEEQLHGYRPLVIQDALRRAGAVFYMERDRRFTRNMTARRFAELYAWTRSHSGVLAWPTKKAVSSLTHKKMFEYFHTDADHFLFVEMVDASLIMMINTKSVSENVMLPWISCVLTQDCVHPIGAQSAGCRFDKKPQYRYSGCHSYDVSALNIALGLSHRLDSSRYTYQSPGAPARDLFARVDLDAARSELAELERNATTTNDIKTTEISVH